MIGFMPAASGLFRELNCAIKNPVVGEGQSIHPQLLRSVQKLVDFGESIQKGIVGVDMKMDKICFVGIALWHNKKSIPFKGLCCLFCYYSLASLIIKEAAFSGKNPKV